MPTATVPFVSAAAGNFRSGRNGNKISLIILHVMEGSFTGTTSWFQNPHARVSAHYLIGKSGKVVQMVQESDTAFHCIGVNPVSIGIEHEGYVADSATFTDAMLASSAAIVREICERYQMPKTREHIKGHNEIPNNNHTDPGQYFPWDKFIALVTGGTGGETNE